MRPFFILFILVLNSNFLNAQKGKLIQNLPVDLPISCIKISSEHRLIAIADDTEDPLGFKGLEEEYKITILDASDYTLRFKLLGHKEPITSVHFSMDSKKLVSTDKGGVIKVWDLTNGTEVTSIDTGEWVHNAKFSSSGDEIVIILGYEKVALLYGIDGELIASLEVNEQINDFDYNPTSNQLYFGCHDEIQIWSLTSRKLVHKIPFEGLMCMTFYHDYSNIAIGTLSGQIVILSPELKEIKKMSGHFKPVLSISLSFDDKKLASSSSDQTARVWDLKKESEILQLVNEHKGTVSSIEFISANYEFMTGGVNKELKVWK